MLLALAEEDLDEARRRLWRALNAAEPHAGAAASGCIPAALVAPARRTGGANLVTGTRSGGREQFRDRPAGPAKRLRSRLGARYSGPAEPLGGRWHRSQQRGGDPFRAGRRDAHNRAGSAISAAGASRSSQVSTRSGESDARGVTGIRDGFRWQASLDALASEDGNVDGVLLRNGKSNYSLRFRPLLLVRNSEPGIEGTLRTATDAEAEEAGRSSRVTDNLQISARTPSRADSERPSSPSAPNCYRCCRWHQRT